jgi:peptide/nickel transport system substrate-binding protein
MKKVILISLAILVSVMMVFGSCGEPEETTQPSSTQPTSTQPTSTQPTSTQPTSTSPTSQPTATTTERPAPYGTLTDVTATFGYDNFDPNEVSSWSGVIFQNLMRTTESGDFEGDVLESYSLSADGLTWTFNLIPNNYFTSGNPVDAAAVKFSIERFADSERSAWSPYLREDYNRVAVNVVDDLTVQYVTDHPEPTLVASFSATAIVDKAAVDTLGVEEYFKAPTGSGPWKLVDYTSGVSVKFEANTDYCRPDEVPHFQYYQQLLVPELATRISMFKTGECDILGLDDYARMKDLQNEGWPVEQYGINGTDSFAFQKSWLEEAGPVHDINIRKAMSYALNRQEICDTWYSGYAIPGGQFFFPHNVFGWTDEIVADAYDPDLAMQLIADAGYPDAFENPVIVVYCQATDQDRMLYYMSYWQAVGLQVELKVMETATYWSYLGFGPPPDDNNGWIWFWKSWSYACSVYHCANMYTTNGVHKTTNDETANAMYAAVTNQLTYEAAREKFAEFQVYVKSLYTNVGVVEYQNYFLYNPNVIGGFDGRHTGYAETIQGATHAQ